MPKTRLRDDPIWGVLYFMALNYPAKIIEFKDIARVCGYRDFIKSIMVLHPDEQFKKCLKHHVQGYHRAMRTDVNNESIFSSRQNMCKFVYDVECACKWGSRVSRETPTLLSRCAVFEKFRAKSDTREGHLKSMDHSFNARHWSPNGFVPLHWGAYYWILLYRMAQVPISTIEQLNSWVLLLLHALGEVLPCGKCRRRYVHRNKSQIVSPLLGAAAAQAARRVHDQSETLIPCNTMIRIIYKLHARVRKETKGDTLFQLEKLWEVLQNDVKHMST